MDPHTFTIFDEANYRPEDAYYRQKDVELFQFALAEQNLEATDVLAVSKCFDLVMVCRTGVVTVGQSGFLKKTPYVRDSIAWATVAEVSSNEPTLRVYEVKLRDAAGSELLELRWSGGGSQNDLLERNRIHALMSRGARGEL
jgi:hypothetical protein